MKNLALLLLLVPLAAACQPTPDSSTASTPDVSGTSLAADVERVEGVSGAVCDDTPHVAKDVITDCTSSGGDKWRVTWNDDQGHFTITKSS